MEELVVQQWHFYKMFVSDIVFGTYMGTILIVLVIVSVWYAQYRHKQQLSAVRQAKELEAQLNDLARENIAAQAQRHDAVEVRLQKVQHLFRLESEIWVQDQALCTEANQHLYNLYTRLHNQYAIEMQDFKICLLTLYRASRAQIAEKICRAESSIPKLRTHTAKKLGTTSTELRTFLLDFMAF